MVRDGRRLRVECVGSEEIIFHGHTDVRHTLFDASYVPWLGFIYIFLHVMQRTHPSGYFWCVR